MKSRVLAIAVWLAPLGASAQTPDEPQEEPAEDEATRRGRESFQRGLELARAEQWAEALESFEEARAARDAAIVRYNIGFCQRALGRYVAARQAFRWALAHGDTLPAIHREDTKGYLKEIDQLLVHLEVTLSPTHAAIAVDGRPLVRSKEDGAWLAGVAPPGEAARIGVQRFRVLLDPGKHLIVAARPGHKNAVSTVSYRSAQRARLELRLDRLPASVRVESQPSQAIVRVGEREVGVAPVDIERPAGSYDLEVTRDGYQTYTAKLALAAGQRVRITAKLEPYVTPLYERWWFWVTAIGAAGSAAVVTWAVARPEPEPPPYESGNTGWLASPAAHF